MATSTAASWPTLQEAGNQIKIKGEGEQAKKQGPLTAAVVFDEIRRAFPNASASDDLILLMNNEIKALKERLRMKEKENLLNTKNGRKDANRLKSLVDLKERYDMSSAGGGGTATAAGGEADSHAEYFCSICQETDGSPGEWTCICEVGMKSGGKHPKFHKVCIKGYISSTISGGFMGMCPLMHCPDMKHVTKERPILPYSKWSSLVEEKERQKYQTFAETFMMFLCGSCHNSKSQLLPFDEALVKNTDKLKPFILDAKVKDKFLAALSEYQLGQLQVGDFYTLVFNDCVPDLRLKEDKDVWEFAKIMISMIQDPERRSTLQLRHFKERPRFLTLCCQREHCFNCKTRDFHTGKSCSENIKGMDSSFLPCPNCNLYLTKGDGCDTVTCPCSHKFSWTPTLTLFKNVLAFSAEFPKDTASKCSEILCGLISEIAKEKKEKVLDTAVHYRNFNKTLVDRLTVSTFQRRFPEAPNQIMAKCMMDPSFQNILNLHGSVVANWNSVNNKKVEVAMKDMKTSIGALLDSLYPTLQEKLNAVAHLSQIPKDQRSRDDITLMKFLAQYKTANNAVWTDMVEESSIKSAKQFLFMYGNNLVGKSKYTREKSLGSFVDAADHFWHKTWCNSSLEISEGHLCAKRPGGSSSYPAAFSEISGNFDVFKVRLEQADSTTNSISFGVSTLNESGTPSLSNQGSDGVGRTSDTYGLIEDRGSSVPLRVYENRNELAPFRKLKVGDVMTAVIDLDAFTLQVSLNNEFTHTIRLPSGQRYCFAMTFANDHKVRILNGELVTLDSILDPGAAALQQETSSSSSSSTGGATSISQHSGTLNCSCAHFRANQTPERYPLNPAKHHIDRQCTWSCCGRAWGNIVCSACPPSTPLTIQQIRDNFPPGRQLFFNKTTSYSYPEFARSEAVTVVSTVEGTPPVQVRWSSGQTYYVNAADLVCIASPSPPMPPAPIDVKAGGGAGARGGGGGEISATPLPVKFLNASHSKMFMDFVRLLKTVNSIPSLDDVKVNASMKALVLEYSKQRQSADKAVNLSQIQTWVEILANKDRDKLWENLPMDETWVSLLAASCFCLVDKARLLREQAELERLAKEAAERELLALEEKEKEFEEIRALQFLENHGRNGDAAFVAAAYLLPDGCDAEDLKLAKAFCRYPLTSELLQEWYCYNSSLPESLLPQLQNAPKSCRCLPRCLKTCLKK